MTWQADAGHGQAEASSQQEVEQAQGDGIADAPIEHSIEVAVFRVVEILFVAGELQFAEQVIVDDADDVFGQAVQIQALAQLAGVSVEQSRVGVQIDVRVLSAAKEQHTLLEVEVLALVEAEGQKLGVGVLAGKLIDDFAGATAQDGIIAQGVLAQPIGTGTAVGKNGFPNGAIHFSVLVRQQVDQGFPMVFLHGAAGFELGRSHRTIPA